MCHTIVYTSYETNPKGKFMQFMVFLRHVLKKSAIILLQKLCPHKWAYKETQVVVGRPCSIFICMRCKKKAVRKYAYEYET